MRESHHGENLMKECYWRVQSEKGQIQEWLPLLPGGSGQQVIGQRAELIKDFLGGSVFQGTDFQGEDW